MGYNAVMDTEQRAKDGRLMHSGMFKPGASGNPSGRPKSDFTISSLAKEHTESALTTLVEVISDKNAPYSARVQAACANLDRGWGKPPQYVETQHTGLSYMDTLAMMPDPEPADYEIRL